MSTRRAHGEPIPTPDMEPAPMLEPLVLPTLSAELDAALPIAPGTVCVNIGRTLCVVTGPFDPARGYLVRDAFDRSCRWYADDARLRIATPHECSVFPSPF